VSNGKYEAWCERTDRPTRFEGRTHLAAIKTAHRACGNIGALLDFNSWLLSRGLKPFNTGKTWVLNIPRALDDKLTAQPTPVEAGETY